MKSLQFFITVQIMIIMLLQKNQQTSLRDSLNVRCNFSLVACFSLNVTHCLQLVVKPLSTRCKIHSFLVADVPLCKKSLVTCGKTRSLLVSEVARSKKTLVTCRKIHLLLFAEVACCKKSIVTCCKICSLLVGEVARYKKSISRYSLQNSLVTRCSLVTSCKTCSLLIAEYTHCKTSLVTRWKIRLLLIAEVAHQKTSLVVKNHSLLVAKFDRCWLHKFSENNQLNLVRDDKIQMNLNLYLLNVLRK